MKTPLYKRLLGYFGISLATLAILRIVFICVYHEAGIRFLDILKALGIGVIVDSSVMSCCIVVCFLLGILVALLSEKAGKRVLTIGLTAAYISVTTLNVVDIFYYGYYNTRLSYNLVRLFGENPWDNFVMLWKGYPLMWIIVGSIVGIVLVWWLVDRFFKDVQMRQKSWQTIAAVIVTFGIFSFLYYGPPFWRLTTFSSRVMLNQAASNGAYTLVKTYSIVHKTHGDMFPFEEQKVQEDMAKNQDFICSEEETLVSSMAPTLRRFNDPDTLEVPKNIIIIIGESFSATLTGVIGQDERSYSPYFDSLCKEGVLFTNCFSNGPRTQHGIVSVMSGFPSIIGSSLIRRREANAFFTIADAVRQEGYETYFIHGGSLDYDDMRDYVRQGNFQHIYGVEDFDTWRLKNDWGVCDEDLFDFAFEKIKEAKQPHLTVILTMSNHLPYDIPEEFAKSHPEVAGYQDLKASYYYADYAWGVFMDSLKTLPEYENTLVLRTADHGEVYSQADRPFRMFHIPALLLNGSRCDTVFDAVCSQMDFVPTLLSEIGYKGAFPCIGRNLFAKDYHPFATMNTYDNMHLWIENGKVVTWDMMSDDANCYRMTSEYVLEPSDLPFDSELQRMKSYLAFLSYVYQKGLYNDAGKN